MRFTLPATPLVKGELKLELTQTQMTQKPMLRAEVYARALRASQNLLENTLPRAFSSKVEVETVHKFWVWVFGEVNN
jgi:hypothetical protein